MAHKRAFRAGESHAHLFHSLQCHSLGSHACHSRSSVDDPDCKQGPEAFFAPGGEDQDAVPADFTRGREPSPVESEPPSIPWPGAFSCRERSLHLARSRALSPVGGDSARGSVEEEFQGAAPGADAEPDGSAHD